MTKHIFLYLLLTIIFISCDDDSGTNPTPQPTHDPALLGVWDLTSLKVNGFIFNPSLAEEIPVRILFETDGKGTVWFENDGVPTLITWSTTGNQISIGDDFVDYIISGNIVTISFVEDDDNFELIYTKSVTPSP